MKPRDTAGDAKDEKSMNVLESCKCVNYKFKCGIHVGIASLASSGVLWCGEVCTPKVGDTGVRERGGSFPLSSPPPPSLLSPIEPYQSLRDWKISIFWTKRTYARDSVMLEIPTVLGWVVPVT